MRRAGRVDANQAEIVSDLRDVGASVAVTSNMGGGFPDIVIGYRGINYLFEIKDGNKPPSARQLTDAEKEFHITWRGAIYVINNSDEALEIIGAI